MNKSKEQFLKKNTEDQVLWGTISGMKKTLSNFLLFRKINRFYYILIDASLIQINQFL